MITIEQLQSDCRVLSHERQLSFFDTLSAMPEESGAFLLNAAHRKFVATFPWGEFTRQEELPVVTVDGQEAYAFSPVNAFADIKMVEAEGVYHGGGGKSPTSPIIGSPVDAPETLAYGAVSAAPSESAWSRIQGSATRSYPQYYRIISDSIHFRPAFSADGRKIRITGKIEPGDFTALTETTAFRSKTADDALANYVAWYWLRYLRRPDDPATRELLERANALLQSIFDRNDLVLESSPS